MQDEDMLLAQDQPDKDQDAIDDDSNIREVEVEGIFIKHDFDHILMNEDEVEKYTNDDLTFSTMKQTIEVPFQYDI